MNTQELQLAILHKVISELEEAGKTKLQKLGYFLQEAMGVPTNYPFRMHHYGPYSEALETDIARLKLAGYVNVDPDQQGYGFHITSIDNPPEEWEQLTKQYEPLIQKAMDKLGSRPTHELELAATIHFVKNLSPTDTPKPEVIAKTRALKPKFDDSYIVEIYDYLEQDSLLNELPVKSVDDPSP